MAVTALCCENCIKSAANKGVKSIIYGGLLDGYNHELTFKLAKEFGIELKEIKL
jgi:deoxycytidylate deaminase